MIKLVKKDKRTELEKEIDRLVGIMNQLDPTSTDYQQVSARLLDLRKARIYDKEDKLSKNTAAMIVGNIVLTGLVLWHERLNVITSKFGQFIIKGRV
jgi:hypothetical protein